MRKRVLVLRLSTDRPEAVRAGFAELVGVDSDSIFKAIERYADDPRLPDAPSPYGDGKAAQRIVDVLESGPIPELGILEDRLAKLLGGLPGGFRATTQMIGLALHRADKGRGRSPPN